MNEQTAKIKEKLSRFLPAGEIDHISHIVCSGKGSYYYDTEGRHYLDFSSGVFTNSFGHGEQELAEVLQQSFAKLANIHGRHWEGETAFYKLLFRYLPDADYRALPLGDGGSYAIDRALGEIYYAHGERPLQLAVFNHGFHGKTIAARSALSCLDTCFFHPITIPAPYCYRCPCGKKEEYCRIQCAELAIACLRQHNADVFLFEPILGSSVIIPPDGYWEKVSRFCREKSIRLVSDEVLVGGGRVGSYIVSTSLGLLPDVILLSKGLSNGLPQSLMLLRSSLTKYSMASSMWHYGSTYVGVPSMIALMTTVLQKIERENILSNVQERGIQLSGALFKLRRRFSEHIGDVRCAGLMGAIEFVRNPQNREPDDSLGHSVYKKAEEKGLELIPGGHILRLGPPLNITEGELSEGIELLQESIEEVLNG